MQLNTKIKMKALRAGYPSVCDQFVGPFTSLCLEALWMDANCAVEGGRAPGRLTAAQLAAIDRLNAS